MSLSLRPALENVTSVDRVLEDLLVRFIINCPPEDLSSVERELFHFEEASWFYTDFIKLMNPTLPNLKIKSFATRIIKLCPLIWKWDIKADEAMQKFSKYKKSIPVRGAAIFNDKLNKILLVQGTESDSWSFPRGKISKDEDDVMCCIREVKEEIGFDLTDYIDENQFIERNIQGKNYKIFLVSGVSEEFQFKPQVRNEIEKIEWRDFKKMSKTMYKSNVKYYLINSMMRPLSMWIKHQKQIKNDDQLKQYAEEQLKLLLGITKGEQVDPGRELLNMLHSAVHMDEATQQQQQQPLSASSTVNNNAPMTTTTTPQTQTPLPIHPNALLYPPVFNNMAFQPFAPFPFVNGNNQFMIPQPNIPLPQPLIPPHPHLPSATPNIGALSKPTLINNHELNMNNNNNNSGKQLLDILHSNQQERKKSNSSQLLDILKKPSNAKQNEPSLLDVLKKPSHQYTTINSNEEDENDNDEESYEVFESSSEDGGDDDDEGFQDAHDVIDNHNENTNFKPPHLDNLHYMTNNVKIEHVSLKKQKDIKSLRNNTTNDQEDYSSSLSNSDSESQEIEEQKLKEIGKEENPPLEISSNDVIIENAFHDGDIPHMDNKDESVKSMNSSMMKENVKKPKFKILKRGENISDIKLDNNEPTIAEEPTTNTDSKTLLNMLKTPKEPEAPSSVLLNILKKPTEEQNDNAKDSNILLNMLKKPSTSPPVANEEHTQNSSTVLLNMLKKQSPESNTDAKGSEELMDMLKHPHNGHMEQKVSPELLNADRRSSTLSPFSMEQSTSINTPNLGNTMQNTIPENLYDNQNRAQYSTASNELLSMLHKKPSNEQQQANPESGLIDSFPSNSHIQNNFSASNELLNILHKRA
ncbi:hypothetical protein NCAS_0G02500 [Naumovozyma castellii]|uniref:Nudix hydrolase domain-containing protein n=1 Tax=Naumovozyma castellii TaxID=27288 RepID=G0VIA2_NAUCA|nr:hypothetical protein NCAS_0G02500 [Naumovozyma castellii CBS 4309]CCC71137.1 hypothetical protein NCAS_0G02500 [Naumovozyma castellii CBS 4309]